MGERGQRPGQNAVGVGDGDAVIGDGFHDVVCPSGREHKILRCSPDSLGRGLFCGVPTVCPSALPLYHLVKGKGFARWRALDWRWCTVRAEQAERKC